MKTQGGSIGFARIPKLRFVVGLVWTVAALLAALLVLKIVQQNVHAGAFNSALRSSESRLSAGDMTGAQTALTIAAKNAQTVSEWLSVLKRVRSLAEDSGDKERGYQTLDSFALRATSAFPGNQSLWAVAVWAELLAGRTADAAEHASRYLTSENFDSLRIEALFRAGKQPTDKQATSSEVKLFTSVPTSQDPSVYRRAGDLTEDRRFYVDMALLQSAHSVTTALKSFDSYRIARMVPAAAALLAYDAGDFESARSFIGFMPPEEALGPEMVLLQADMNMAAGSYAMAHPMYEDLLRRHPNVSPVAYRNLAFLALEGTSAPESKPGRLPRTMAPTSYTVAEQYLTLGLRRFPGTPELVRALAALRLLQNRRDQAITLVNAYLTDHPEDSSMRLYRLLHLEQNAPPARTTSQLWNLVNAGPENASAGQVLADRLLVLRDLNGLGALLERFREKPIPTWVSFYRAVLKAVREDTGGARAEFTAIWAADQLWQAPFDAALTYLAEGSILPAQ
ncbi:MAG TPA: hypothetical protein VMW87_11995, partial [Spirochaetia bacterium]|nr:hypothetical protein [Spirochaetia bacterium]